MDAVTFTPPTAATAEGVHHAQAAAGNAAVAEQAVGALRDALSGDAPYERFLLRAAAGAGKSFVLKRLIAEAIEHPYCQRVAVTAFTNRQTFPLAESLGRELGSDKVCLLISAKHVPNLPASLTSSVTVASGLGEIPDSASVVVSVMAKLAAHGHRAFSNTLGTADNGQDPFDVLFVDEAWQLAEYNFDKIARFAPLWVGVGDVGQLPPLEVGANPWRGDTHNPYRAWPAKYENDDKPETWVRDLPAVWRPAAGHLGLWRAFYPGWGALDCVADEGDRWMEFGAMSAAAESVWRQVGTGVPTLLEIDGLPAPDAPDVDLPLLNAVEALIDELLAAGVAFHRVDYDDAGTPNGGATVSVPGVGGGDPSFAILATRNQAVDDAGDAADRLVEKHGLTAEDVQSSTVDSWQGQTNAITVAVHPLSGASELDDFNSAFGRLAVTCTRATHGLLMVVRPGLDALLEDAPARPGTPMGEPGFRTLPRQTHQRILASFARGTLIWNTVNDKKEE
jgi:hypothetical protein